MHYESGNFSDSSSLFITIFNPKIFGFLFFAKNSSVLPPPYWKVKLQKIVVNLLDKLRKLYMNGTVII